MIEPTPIVFQRPGRTEITFAKEPKPNYTQLAIQRVFERSEMNSCSEPEEPIWDRPLWPEEPPLSDPTQPISSMFRFGMWATRMEKKLRGSAQQDYLLDDGRWNR